MAKQERKTKMAQYRKLAKEFLQQDERAPTLQPEAPIPAAPKPLEIDSELLATRLADTLESRMPVVVETPPPAMEKPKRKRAQHLLLRKHHRWSDTPRGSTFSSENNKKRCQSSQNYLRPLCMYLYRPAFLPCRCSPASSPREAWARQRPRHACSNPTWMLGYSGLSGSL